MVAYLIGNQTRYWRPLVVERKLNKMTMLMIVARVRNTIAAVSVVPGHKNDVAAEKSLSNCAKSFTSYCCVREYF